MIARSIGPYVFMCCIFIAVVMVFTAPQTLHAQTTAIKTAGNASAGRATFTQYCSICHGSSAQGFIGPRIAGINFGEAGVLAIVRQGLGGYGGMPPFSRDSVSDRDVDDIAAYLVSLGPPPAAAAPAQALSTAATGIFPEIASPHPIGSGGSRGDAAHGRDIFSANCASCHGTVGEGGFGPSLKNEKIRKNYGAAVRWIKDPAPPMPKLYPTPLSETDVADVAAFIESL